MRTSTYFWPFTAIIPLAFLVEGPASTRVTAMILTERDLEICSVSAIHPIAHHPSLSTTTPQTQLASSSLIATVQTYNGYLIVVMST